MSNISNINGKIIPTKDSYRLGTKLLDCFFSGTGLPKPSCEKEIIRIIEKVTQELKANGIDKITSKDYARYLKMLNHRLVVDNALAFVYPSS